MKFTVIILPSADADLTYFKVHEQRIILTGIATLSPTMQRLKQSDGRSSTQIVDIIKIRMCSLQPFAGVTADCTIHSKWPSPDRVYTDTSDG